MYLGTCLKLPPTQFHRPQKEFLTRNKKDIKQIPIKKYQRESESIFGIENEIFAIEIFIEKTTFN